MNELHDKILGALPASMRDLGRVTGVQGEPLWDAVKTLRQAGIIRRYGPHGERMYEKVGAPRYEPPDPNVSPGVAASEEQKKQRKERKRAVILFWIEGWPSQDPNRRMLWSIVWNGEPTAKREMKRLEKKFRKDGVKWELAKMSAAEARRLKERGFSLREQREREKMMSEAAGEAS